MNRKYISANQRLQSVLSWRQPGTHEQPVALKIVWSPVVCSFLLFNTPVQRANIMTFDVRRWVRGASGSLWRVMKGKVVVVVCCLWALDEITVGSASHATEAAKVITMVCCVWHERAQFKKKKRNILLCTGFSLSRRSDARGFVGVSLFAHVQMSSTSFARREPDYNQHSGSLNRGDVLGWFGLQKKLCSTFCTQTSKHSVISHQ